MSTTNINDLYKKDEFILHIDSSDTQIRLQNVLFNLKHTLSPHEVVTMYVQNKELKIKTQNDIHVLCFSDNSEALDALTCLQLALDQIINNINTGPTGGISSLLGLPTDGAYGFLYPSLTGVAAGDRVEDAFDKVTTFLERFVPAPPPNLSAIFFTPPSFYTALQENTGTLHTDITSNLVETLYANTFYDGLTGTLSADINGNLAGSINITNGDDTGLTNNNLNILSDIDFYLGDSTKETFWFALSASIVTSAPNTLILGLNTISLSHSNTGSINITMYLDDPSSPLITIPNITTTSTGSYISGVPFLITGDTVLSTFNVDNAVSEYYNQTKIGELVGTSINNSIYQPIISPLKGSTVNASITTTILSNIYEPGAVFILNGYSSNNIVGTTNVLSNLNIDSLSNEIGRVQSGTGQFPLTYSSVFDSSSSILPTEELQMINGQYRFPITSDYSSYNPVGPDYTAITGGSYLNMRWVTFQPITITNVVGIDILFNNATGFGVTALMSGFELYVKVEGSTGWLNANAAYPGVGVPSLDNDSSLVIGSSSATHKRVTFSTVRSGLVSIRIGIPSGSSKAFESITVTV